MLLVSVTCDVVIFEFLFTYLKITTIILLADDYLQLPRLILIHADDIDLVKFCWQHTVIKQSFDSFWLVFAYILVDGEATQKIFLSLCP